MMPTPWQEVIHGDAHELRASLCSWLEAREQANRSVAVALCGTNDKVIEGADGYRVKPMRCGHAMCPRCSRYRGYRYVRRVTEHLRSRGHGTLLHVVLTQQIDKDERLGETAKRFERRFEPWFLRAKRLGHVVAALKTVHITWSNSGGWHYHSHVVVETSEVAEVAEHRWGLLVRDWSTYRTDDGDTKAHLDVVRIIAGPGEAMSELDEGSSDFWTEAQSKAEQAVQYVSRDVCQGVGSWNLKECGDRVGELFGDVAHAKLRRLYGTWRKAVPAEEVIEAKEAAADAPRPYQEGDEDVGTVDDVLWRCSAGPGRWEQIALWLLSTCSNKSAMGERLKSVIGRFVGDRRSVVGVS